MATSNSVNFNLTVNEIISEILEQLAVIPPGGDVRGEDYSSCLRTLNLMIKSWQMRGIYLWAESEGYIFLNEGQASYKLAGSNPDKAVKDYIATEISSDEASGQTVLSVTSSSGMAINDIIGIELDDGTLHWTTIAALPTSTSVTVNSAITDDAGSGNNVYTYDPLDVINRPLEITSARLRIDETSDVKLYPISKKVYFNIPNKDIEGQPIQFYVDKQRDHSRLYVYPTSSSSANVIHFSYRRILEDLDGSTDDLDFPQEALLALVYNGCVHIAPKYGKSQNISEMTSGSPSIASLAQAYFKMLEDDNQEQASIYIRPWVPN